jgi:phenylacetate-CoA ligase
MKRTPLDAWIHQKINPTLLMLTRQEIDDWQLMKLNETLAWVRTNSAFYHRHFAGLPKKINTLEEIEQFPFTTPEDVRRNPLQFVCVSQDEIQRVVTLQSSGTTGEPKRLYYTKEDQELTMDFFGVGISTLVEAGERVMICLPVEKPGSVGDLLGLGLQRIGAEPIPYGPVGDVQDALETMQSGCVDSIVGSPTQMLGLARRWRKGWQAPRTVLLSTDFVPGAIKHELEMVWECEVYNHYGTTEMGLGGGVECAAHRGYHMREADLLVEIVDPESGLVLPHSAYGEVVFSTLTRSGMPLMRYRMGDRSRILPGPCPCGTPLYTLEQVSGRFENRIAMDGGFINLADLDEAIFAIPDVLDFKASVLGQAGKYILMLEVYMLTARDVKAEIEMALSGVSELEKLELRIDFLVKPDYIPDLHKRVIVDGRK